jgi:hypothetical protein
MLEDIGTKDTSSKASRQFNETLSQLKADYKDNSIPFDMSIISKLMRTQRRAGVIIMDYMLSAKRNESNDIIGLQVRLLKNEHGVRDARPLNNFNVNTLAFREFGVGYDHDLNLPGLAEGMDYTPPLIDIREEHLNSLGINNHMVEMPTVKLSNESLQNAELVTTPLTHVEIEYDEVTEEEKEPEVPLVPTTESFDELKERFIPTRDIVKVIPSTRGRFY